MAFPTPIAAYPNFGTSVATPPAGAPGAIADGATYNSDLISGGYGGVIVGATSDHAATLTIQRYADKAGLIPVGPLSSQALVGGTAGWTGFADGLPYVCFNVAIINSAGAIANITNFAILTGPAL